MQILYAMFDDLSHNCMDMFDDYNDLCLYHLYRITLYIYRKLCSLLFAKKLDLLDMILAYSTSETHGCLGGFG